MSCPVALIGPSVTPISVDHKAREHRRPGEVPRWVHAKRLDRNRNGIRNRTWPPSYLRCSAMQTIRALRAAALLVRIRLAPRGLPHPATNWTGRRGPPTGPETVTLTTRDRTGGGPWRQRS